jgi:hypothetical protein
MSQQQDPQTLYCTDRQKYPPAIAFVVLEGSARRETCELGNRPSGAHMLEIDAGEDIQSKRRSIAVVIAAVSPLDRMMVTCVKMDCIVDFY